MPFIQKSPLEYPANTSTPQRRWQDTRDPTTTDYKQFRLGDLWLNTTNSSWWILCDRDSTSGLWRKAASDDTLQQVTAEDSTIAIPVSNNLDIVGTATNGINTTASGDTLTISMASPYADGDFVFTNATAATPRSVTISNTDVDAASSSSLGIVTEPSSGDSFVQFSINGTLQYSLGIDNSDNDNLKLTTGSGPSAGTELIEIENDATDIFINVIAISQHRTIAGGGVEYYLKNFDDTPAADSQCIFKAEVGGDNTIGDPFILFTVSGSDNYSLGIDNSDSNNFKITTGASPSLGIDLFTMTTAGVITLNNDLDVTEGGTGRSSATAYAVICGGTTATGDHQSIASVGTAGQILTSNGAGALPTFQDPAIGDVVQEIVTTDTNGTTCTTQIPIDNTIPQNTEGDEVLTVTITPTDASNDIELYFHSMGTAGGANHDSVAAIFVDSTANALHAESFRIDSGEADNVSIFCRVSAGSTSARTYKLRIGVATAGTTTYINSNVGAAVFGGVNNRYLIAKEIQT